MRKFYSKLGFFALTAGLFISSSVFAQDLVEPKSFYDFNLAATPLVMDLGTAANNGELIGGGIAFIAEGYEGAGITLTDGAYSGASFVKLPFNAAQAGENYTYSLWVKWNNAEGRAWTYLIWDNGEEETLNRHVDLWANPGNFTPASVIHNVDGTELRLEPEGVDSAGSIFDLEWHQIALTLANSNLTTIYVDGVQLGQIESEGTIADRLETNDLQVGGGHGMNWEGDIDNLRIYDVALTAEQVLAQYDEDAGTYVSVENISNSNLFALKQNRPNPFSSETTIAYDLEKAGFVELQIFDVTGKVISTVEQIEKQAGSYEVNWSPNSELQGVYFCKLTVTSSKGVYSNVKKMLIK